MNIRQSITLTEKQRKLLRDARTRRNLSTDALGAAVGCSGAMVRMIELGRKPAPAKLLEALADKLGLRFSAKMVVSLARKKS